VAPWWPCFICGDTGLCPHRELEIVAWMHAAPSLAQIAASRPERVAPATTTFRDCSKSQLELFGAAAFERRRA
jgi:hypothetical protein